MNNAQARRMSFTENKEGLTFRGKGLKKQRWFSLCSAHMEVNKDCPRCTTGSWHNVYMLKVDTWFHDHTYNLWYWWVNNI